MDELKKIDNKLEQIEIEEEVRECCDIFRILASIFRRIFDYYQK